MYSIAITLLVLELGVPDSSEGLMGKLSDDWPSFLGYLVSFVFIGGSWLSHVKLTRLLSNSDDVFVGLNLLTLLFVSLLPFTTSVMANNLADAGQRPAAVLFGLNLTLASTMSAVLCGYAIRAESLVDEGERPVLRGLIRERRNYTAMFGLSTAVGVFLPAFAVFFYLAISAFVMIKPLIRLEVRIRRRHQWDRDRDQGDDQ